MKRFLLLSFILLTIASSAAAAPPNRLTIEVTEPSGAQRGRAPVHMTLRLPERVPTTTGFRLLHEGTTLPAQFRPIGEEATADSWWLDFFTPIRPSETRRFSIEYGPAVKPGPEQKNGHQLLRKEDAFVVSHAPHIDWIVPRDFAGFLRSVRFAPNEHLRPDSPGFALRDVDGNTHPLGGSGVRAEVLREGRATVALRFHKRESSQALRGVSWTADLVFPGGLSWVEVRLAIEDPRKRVAAIYLQLDLLLDPATRKERTLVELGADRTVYRALVGDDRIALTTDPENSIPWRIDRNLRGKWEPFVLAAPNAAPPEGWTHVMDRKRCLSLAFEDFGREARQQLEIHADGTVKASKTFQEGGSRNLRAWLHFVQFPPQQSANTDPHMMQNPLVARQLSGGAGRG